MPFTIQRAETNTNPPSADDNGGFPLPETVSLTGTLPAIFAAWNSQELYFARKLIFLADQSYLFTFPYYFSEPDETLGDHYFNFVLEPEGSNREVQSEMLADISNRRRYGVLELTSAATAGVTTTLAVKVKNAATLTGAEKIIYADGASETDTAIIDARVEASTADTGAHEEAVVTDISSIVTSTAVLQLSAAVQNDYAIGDKVHIIPAKRDIVPTYSDYDDTNMAAATFDPLLLELYYSYTWEDTITVTLAPDTSGNYTVSSERFGVYAGIGNKSTDFACTNPGFASAAFTILAGAIAGTIAGGESFTIQTHGAMFSMWVQYFHPVNANVKRGELIVAARAELEVV
jgi:hypothetical protein